MFLTTNMVDSVHFVCVFNNQRSRFVLSVSAGDLLLMFWLWSCFCLCENFIIIVSLDPCTPIGVFD